MSQSASTRAWESSRENHKQPELDFAPDGQHPRDWARAACAQQARVQTDSSAYINRGILPDSQFAPSAPADRSRPEDVLSDPNASAQQKLQTVESLAASGKQQITITDKDGTQRHCRLELEHQGNKTLVHMYAEEGGKERVLLRGISNGDGTYSHEKDGRGNDVSFNGTWWSQHMANRSALEGTGDDSAQAGNGRQTRGRGNVDTGYSSGENQYGDNQYGDRSTFGDQNTDQTRNQLQIPATGDQAAWNDYFDSVGAGRGARSMHQLSNGNVYFKAGMTIDADGAPDARRIDRSGSTSTSLRYADNSSVNAHEVPYIVLPGGQYQKYGIHPGDMAAVRYNGQVTFAVFADVGPGNKIGEGSMNLAAQLGISNNPTRGGVSGGVEYIVIPGSGNRRPVSADEIAANGARLMNGSDSSNGSDYV